RLERFFAGGAHAVRGCAGTRGDDLRDRRPLEADGDLVVDGDSPGEAVADELGVARPAQLLAVVVRAGAPAEEAEPVPHSLEPRAERVGDAGFEPADRARAPPRQHD